MELGSKMRLECAKSPKENFLLLLEETVNKLKLKYLTTNYFKM